MGRGCRTEWGQGSSGVREGGNSWYLQLHFHSQSHHWTQVKDIKDLYKWIIFTLGMVLSTHLAWVKSIHWFYHLRWFPSSRGPLFYYLSKEEKMDFDVVDLQKSRVHRYKTSIFMWNKTKQHGQSKRQTQALAVTSQIVFSGNKLLVNLREAGGSS